MECILMHSGYMCASVMTNVANAKDRLLMCVLNSHDTLICMCCGLALLHTHHPVLMKMLTMED